MGFGFKELLIILLIVLVLFGAKRLRNLGSDLGSAIRGFRSSLREGEEEKTPAADDPAAKGQAAAGGEQGRVIEGEAQRQGAPQERHKV